MATGENKTLVNTFIQVTYSLLGGDPNHLLRRELHRIKDDVLTDFVTVFDETTDVGEKDDYSDFLGDRKDKTVTERDDEVDRYDDQIEILTEQINEIDSL